MARDLERRLEGWNFTRKYPPDTGRGAALYTQGSSCSLPRMGEGELCKGQMADFRRADQRLLKIPPEEVTNLASHLTVGGGEVFTASHDFQSLAPPTASGGRWTGLQWHKEGASQVEGPHAGTLFIRAKATARHAGAAKLGEAIWGLGCDCFAF